METHEYFPVMLSSRKACINSALFCQNALQYLVSHFSSRLHIYEHSPVTEIRLLPNCVNEVWADQCKIDADDVILCTNGFENFHIIDLHHPDSRHTDKIFHKNIHGLVGYMAGFLLLTTRQVLSVITPRLYRKIGNQSNISMSRVVPLKKMKKRKASSVSEARTVSYQQKLTMMRRAMTPKNPTVRYNHFSNNIAQRRFQKNSPTPGMVSWDILTQVFVILAKILTRRICGTTSDVMVLELFHLPMVVGR